MAAKKVYSFTATPTTLSILKELSESLLISQAQVIELALSELYNKKPSGVKLSATFDDK